MKLFDAHHHLWNLEVLDYIWLKQIGKPKPFGDPTPIQKDYLAKHFLNDVAEANGIQLAGSVHIQVDSALIDPVSETSWLSKLVPAVIPSAITAIANNNSDLPVHAKTAKSKFVRAIKPPAKNIVLMVPALIAIIPPNKVKTTVVIQPSPFE